ncbi:conserved protein of unknown function [uncultured Sphingopyxis sp.]|nr:conserved protein of unknown function [uncultured Sphingopyxis sp.]
MATGMTRYSYGGHATFPVRYGWLPKGLLQMQREGAFHPTTEVADELGLGSKMVESLGFWLRATGLADDSADARSGRVPSQAAKLVLRYDPYCELPGTWWFLHLFLTSREGSVWHWFFNDFAERHFDRAMCTDAFLDHVRAKAVRPASPAVAQKDVACILSAYAARPGVDFVDPDDVGACPLRELGLILRQDVVRRFERARSPVGLPPEAFLASVSLLSEATGKDALSLRELATLPGGPGRIFCSSFETIDDIASRAADALWMKGVSIESLAGERHVLAGHRKVESWMQDYYERIEADV